MAKSKSTPTLDEILERLIVGVNEPARVTPNLVADTLKADTKQAILYLMDQWLTECLPEPIPLGHPRHGKLSCPHCGKDSEIHFPTIGSDYNDAIKQIQQAWGKKREGL